MAKERDLLAIRRPPRQVSQHRRENQLQLLRSIDFASPHRAIGAVVVCDPLAIAREVQPHRRDSQKVRKVYPGFRIVANQFPPRLPALREEFVAIAARHGIADIHRSRRQLHRRWVVGDEKAATFAEGPQVCRPVARRLENEIPSVRRPVTAAFVVCAVPPWQQRMKIVAVRPSLPDGAFIGMRIVQREPQKRSVVRPANVVGRSIGDQEPAWFAAVALRQKYFVALAESNSLSVWRPSSSVALEISQSTRSATQHGHGPERTVEHGASRRIHQECRPIRRNIKNV